MGLIDDAKAKAADLANDVKDKAEDIKDDIQHKADDAKNEIQEKADEAKQNLQRFNYLFIINQSPLWRLIFILLMAAIDYTY